MNESSRDSIVVKNLKADVRVGITDVELASAQEVSICLHLVPGHCLSDLDDDITRTVDYHSVTQQVKKVASSRPRKLIETLAEDIADMLLAGFDLVHVTVEIRKYILAETDYVAVHVSKKR